MQTKIGCIDKQLLVDVNSSNKGIQKSALNKATKDAMLFEKSFQKAWTNIRNNYIKNLCNA